MNIDSLYQGMTIKEMAEASTGLEIIKGFRTHLSEILASRHQPGGSPIISRYFEERTSEIALELMELYGYEHPKELIFLLSEQEFTLLTSISNQVNLFEYLMENMHIVQELQADKVYSLLYRVLGYNAEQIYGKKVYSSYGNRGNSYYGFENTLYSNPSIKISVPSLTFELQVEVYRYKMIELGRDLGVSEKTLQQLEKANERTEFLKLPKNRKRSTAIPPMLRSGETVDYVDEVEFKQAVMAFTNELNQTISKEFPGYTVKTSEFFQTRSDVDTDFSICIEKTVPFQNGYESTRTDLIQTIKQFNEIEDKYFGLDYVVDELVAFRQERASRRKPLFS